MHFREKGLAEPKTSWHALDVRATAEALATDAARGLSPAEAESRLAASTLGRYRQLQVEKSVSPQEMDEVARRSEAASARLEAARARLDETADPDQAIEILQELADLAREIEAELQRAKRSAETEAATPPSDPPAA